MYRTLVLMLLTFSCLSRAQEVSQTYSPTPPEKSEIAALLVDKDSNEWKSAALQLEPGTHVQVVTLDHPGRRSACKVASASNAELICESGLTALRTTFPSEKIAAVILPPVHTARRVILLIFVSGASLIAGACLAPITLGASIPMGVLGGLALLADGALATGDNADRPEAFSICAQVWIYPESS